MQVLTAEVRQDFIIRALLRQVGPRLSIDIRQLFHRLQFDGRRGGQQFLVPGHVDRIMNERAGQREIEEVLKCRRRERLQVDRRTTRYLTIQYGDRPCGTCSNNVSF